MSIRIQRGDITSSDGDGIRIADPSGGLVISDTKIQSKHTGIVIGSEPSAVALSDDQFAALLGRIAVEVSKLPIAQRLAVESVVNEVRQTSDSKRRIEGLRVVYDLTVGVASSTIATLLAAVVGLPQ